MLSQQLLDQRSNSFDGAAGNLSKKYPRRRHESDAEQMKAVLLLQSLFESLLHSDRNEKT